MGRTSYLTTVHLRRDLATAHARPGRPGGHTPTATRHTVTAGICGTARRRGRWCARPTPRGSAGWVCGTAGGPRCPDRTSGALLSQRNGPHQHLAFTPCVTVPAKLHSPDADPLNAIRQGAGRYGHYLQHKVTNAVAVVGLGDLDDVPDPDWQVHQARTLLRAHSGQVRVAPHRRHQRSFALNVSSPARKPTIAAADTAK